MPYRLLRDESVATAVRRIAREQVDRAIAEVRDAKLDRHGTVHQVRKRCKKLRGLVRLVRPQFDPYARENKVIRDAARGLSDVRDAQSVIESFDDLMEHFEDQVDTAAFASVREQLTSRREEVADEEVELEQRLDKFLQCMQELRQRVDSWTLQETGFDAVAGGLVKTYDRGRCAMDRAVDEPTAENFHEWRKRVKYHWYHARLLRLIWKPMMKAYRREASQLADDLGDDHDLSVLQATILAGPDEFGEPRDIQALAALMEARQSKLRKRARNRGRRLFAEKPKHLARRFHAYWQAWR